MAGEKTVETTGLLGWLDRRFPVTSTWKAHLSEYYAPTAQAVVTQKRREADAAEVMLLVERAHQQG